MSVNRSIGDAPHGDTVDELRKVSQRFALFSQVASREVQKVLVQALERLNSVGEGADARYEELLVSARPMGQELVEAIAHEFGALPEEGYVNRWALVQLVSDLREPEALPFLRRVISSPIPPERSPDPHSSTRAREAVVRTTALEAVARLAREGDPEARAALAEYATHEVRSIKIAAALSYLEVGGAAAREDLVHRLPSDEHWILEIRRAHPKEARPIEGHRFLAPRSARELTPPPPPTVQQDQQDQAGMAEEGPEPGEERS